MDINEKLDELFLLLDHHPDILKIEELKKKISQKEINLINNYRNNPTIHNKKKLYENDIINDYLISESNINFLILGINNKFKRSRHNESD